MAVVKRKEHQEFSPRLCLSSRDLLSEQNSNEIKESREG
jgi:hypothetical protein